MVLGGLETLPGPVAAAARTLTSEEQARAGRLLVQLADRVAQSDAQAGDLAGELTALLHGTALARAFEPVAKAVAAYDFEVAAEHICLCREQPVTLPANKPTPPPCPSPPPPPRPRPAVPACSWWMTPRQH